MGRKRGKGTGEAGAVIALRHKSRVAVLRIILGAGLLVIEYIEDVIDFYSDESDLKAERAKDRREKSRGLRIVRWKFRRGEKGQHLVL